MTEQQGTFANDFAAAIPAGRLAIEETEAWSFDRAKYLNASEAMGCIRRQWFAKRKPGKAWKPSGPARRGTHAEAYMIESLEAAGYIVVHALGDQLSFVDAEDKLSASPDGFVVGFEGAFWPYAIQIETKTIHPLTNRGNLPKAQHIFQVELGMELADVLDVPGRMYYGRGAGTDDIYYLEEDLELPVMSGVILYMDASDYDDVTPFTVERRPGVVADAMKRYRKVFSTRKVDGLDREGKALRECRYCPFQEECGVTADEIDETKAKVTRGNRGSKLADQVEAYGTQDEIEKAAKAAKDELKEPIKEQLRKRNKPSLDVGDWTVTLSKRAGPKRLDKTALQAAIDNRVEELGGPTAETVLVTDHESQGKPSEALSVKRRAT